MTLSRSSLAADLEYYLERKPTCAEITDALDWCVENPGANLSEYVDAMKAIGEL